MTKRKLYFNLPFLLFLIIGTNTSLTSRRAPHIRRVREKSSARSIISRTSITRSWTRRFWTS